MKISRPLPFWPAVFVLLAITTYSAYAQSVTWIGDGDVNNIAEPDNWSEPPADDGSADVEFGDVTAIYSSIYVPDGVALHDLTFTSTASTSYTFSGDSPSALLLNGDITAGPGSFARFFSSLNIGLSEGLHLADIGTGATIIVDGTIGELDPASIHKTGDGTLVLNGSNIFSQGVTVSGGTLVLGSDSFFYEVLQYSPVGLGVLTLEYGSTLTSLEEYSIDLHNEINLNAGGGAVTIQTPQYGSLNLYGTITGDGYLDVWGPGELVLDNPLSDFNGVSIHEGEVRIGTSSTNTDGIKGPLGSDWVKIYGGATLGLTGSSTSFLLHNSVTLDCTDGSTAMVEVGSEATLNLAGVISGEAHLEKVGDGSLILSGANNFAGGLIVSGGDVTLSTDTAAGTGPMAMGEYTGAHFLSSAPVVNGLSAPSPYHSITLATGSTLTIVEEGNATVNGGIAGTGASIVKWGEGTLHFTGTNTYSGGTVIKEGVLMADHGDGSNVVDALGSGTVTLDGGALRIGDGLSFANVLTFGAGGGTLAGNGTFTSGMNLGSGVTLAPGNSPGTLTFAAGLNVNDGLITEIEINGAANNPGVTSDLLVVNGAGLDLSAVSAGGYTLKLISLTLLGGDVPGAVDDLGASASWTIFQTTGLSGYLPGSSQFTLDSSGFVTPGTFSLTQSGNNLVLNFTAVPEPSTYALLGLGLAMAGLGWRRRRAS